MTCDKCQRHIHSVTTNCFVDEHGFVGPLKCSATADLCPLHAAAGELLDALKSVVALSDRNTKEWDEAKAAIKKAEGAQ